MHISLLGFSRYIPSDVIAAWLSVIPVMIVLLIYVIKKKKFPVIWDYMTTTNHRKIGIMYILFGFIFFLRAGVDALLIRSQLAIPDNEFWVIQFEKYNEVFTNHGTIMIFFAAMPLLLGLMNVAVPLQIGARDLAFPFLNALGFWMFLAGALFFNIGFFLDSASAVGWTGYAPHSTSEFTPGINTDFYVFGVQIAGLGTVMTALNLIVTIVRHKAPGMKLTRMPLFAWSALITSTLIVIAFTVLAVALYMLMFDRQYGTAFFSGSEGDPVLWQHLFWIFGHPEVYILALPTFGLFSDIISTFSEKRVFGYPAMVVSLIMIGFLGYTVWAHHMFTVGLGPVANTFFAIATMLIAIPTGIKVFNWLFTIRGGRLHLTTPMLFALGFIPSFVMGGVTGVMLSMSAANFQFHDTHFVVAHFHYVIISSTILGIFAGIYYYYPKMFGYKLNETLGKWHFWIFLIGFHMTFLPMHITGMNGMPRRTFTYRMEDGLTVTNMISTVGAFLMGASMLFLFWNIVKTHRKAVKVGPDPWNGRTLEWSVDSPAPEETFNPMPIINDLDAFWDAKQEGKSLPTTTETRAAPIARASILPLLLAFSLFIVSWGITFTWNWLAIAGGITFFTVMIIRNFTDERQDFYGRGDKDE